MMRIQFRWLCVICCFCLLVGPSPAQEGPAVKLKVIFKGLPERTSDDTLLLRIVEVDDAKTTEVMSEDQSHEMSVDVPVRPVTLWATYFSYSSGVFLEGTEGVLEGDESVEISMERPAPDVAQDQSALTTYPPDEGMAIGYNPAHFIATGPDVEPWLGEALSNIVVTTLSSSPCAGGENPPFQIVESANPQGMARLEAELKLQASSDVDPASRVTPHIIAATHLVKGLFTMGNDNFIAELRVEDLEGNVIAEAKASGSADQPADVVEEAARQLAEELCKK